MTATLTFSVRGTPRPKARPRFIRGRAVTTTKPKEKLWRLAVERAAKAAVANRGDPIPLFRGAVRVRMVFTFEPPVGKGDRLGTPHTHKPDAENCSKLVLDAMERAGVFKNDSQASQAPPEKWWGERAGVVVIVEPIDHERRPSPSSIGCPRPDWLS
jgi:Holliday junction resolvase RusA-like endonuclease